MIREATPDDMDLVRTLFREYEANIGVDLCFQGFEDELRELPGRYARPRGFIFVAYDNDKPAGCIALKPLAEAMCEMKRLFVRPEFRGKGIAKQLANLCLGEAANLGYEVMKLDTLQTMQAAISLYRSLGFTECAPYYDNPLPEVVYMEKNLRAPTVK